MFGSPKSVFGDIRFTRENSLVDDWIDLLLIYEGFRVRLKASFFVREANPAYTIHGKKGSFLKPRGDVQEDELKIGKKPNLESWGTELEGFEGLLHTEIDGKPVREKIKTLQGNYFEYFNGVYEAIANNKPEPVTAQDGIKVMQIIEAAIASSAQQKTINL